jgi:hypothetical protein
VPQAYPRPESLQAELRRLSADDAAALFPNAAALLEELDAVTDVPGNAAAWERLLRHVREQAADGCVRLSA